MTLLPPYDDGHRSLGTELTGVPPQRFGVSWMETSGYNAAQRERNRVWRVALDFTRDNAASHFPPGFVDATPLPGRRGGTSWQLLRKMR